MLYGLKCTIQPTVEPIALQEAKDHLRVIHCDEDALIKRLISAARGHVEKYTRRQLCTATWRWTADYFPSFRRQGSLFYDRYERFDDLDTPNWQPFALHQERMILLPKPPLQSVSAITYVDTNGTTQTLATSKYLVDAESEPGRVAEAYGESWPDTQLRVNSVQVVYVNGYGAAASVPSNLVAACFLMLGHLFENREAVVVGSGAVELPMAVQSLCDPFRVEWPS